MIDRLAAMPRRGLWTEIGLTLALLTVLVSILDVGVFTVVTRYTLDQATADLSERGARLLATELAAEGRDEWSAVVDRYRRSGMRDVTVYDPTGRVLAGEPVQAERAVREAVALREVTSGDDGGAVYAVAPIGASSPLGAVRFAMPRTTTAVPDWAVILVHAGLSSTLIGVFGFSVFRRALIRPFERIRGTTQRIAAGDFGSTVGDDGPREIVEMATALNTMSTALAAYRERTAEQVHHLEAANVELQRAQEALVRSERLASVGRLAAGLAHELGNPLAAVRGYVELLGEEPALSPPNARAFVVRAQREVERMHELLRDLLDFARLDAHTLGPVRAGDLFADALRTVRPQASFRDVAATTEVVGDVVLWGDAGRLHQVLVNLLLNAADAHATTLRLRAWVDGDAHLSVADDGDGIAPEHLGRLFEPFFTTRPPGKGTGLGLAIAQRILEQHGGRIDVQSAPGEGTTFTLSLPAAG